MKELSFNQAWELATAALERANGDLLKLPDAMKTFLLIHSAQGTIDNGGLEYFFGSDFPDKPPYSQFVNAYRTIGAHEAANLLEQATELFGFENPHLYAEKRIATLNANHSDFEKLSDKLCGDDSIWKMLDDYVAVNSAVFELAKK